jgi:predicted helicase
VDYEIIAKSQCFPLYWYKNTEESKIQTKQSKLFDGGSKTQIQSKLFNGNDESSFTRHDGISDGFLLRTRSRYKNEEIKKEDIFFYVYGLLHSPEYREKFSDDLKMSLPRIPLVKTFNDFKTFSGAGRKLADLHLNYEKEPPCEDVKMVGARSDFIVDDWLRFAGKGKKDTIKFNSKAWIENIPDKAYEYVVNGRSAIEWVMDRYQNTVDDKTNIRNDANLYGQEIGQPDYILNLLLSVISVSIKTVDIVNSLPSLNYDLEEDYRGNNESRAGVERFDEEDE